MQPEEISDLEIRYEENLMNVDKAGVMDKNRGNLAIIATVIDWVKGEVETLKRAAEGEGEEERLSATTPIEVFSSESRHVYESLKELGCKMLGDITGWRRVKDMGQNPDIVKLFQIRLGSRYALLPLGFTVEDIRTISAMMNKAGLPFPDTTSCYSIN